MAKKYLVKNQLRPKQAFKNELVGLIAKINKDEVAERFLKDLLTPSEFNELALRWQIVKLLHRGLSIRNVAFRLGVAVSTVERGARELKYSKSRGFSELLK